MSTPLTREAFLRQRASTSATADNASAAPSGLPSVFDGESFGRDLADDFVPLATAVIVVYAVGALVGIVLLVWIVKKVVD